MAGGQASGLGPRASRQAIVVIGCFLLGLAVAIVLSSAASARSAPKVSDTDYVLMVADVFDHEKSVFNARERLTVIGKNPLDLADAAVERTQKEHPDARRDLDSLRQLAQALRQADVEAGTAARAASGPGLLGLIGLIVASVVLAAGAAWVWKQIETRGGSSPRVDTGRGASSRLRESPLLAFGRRRWAAALTQVGSQRRRASAVEERDEMPAAAGPSRPSRLRPSRPSATAVAERPAMRAEQRDTCAMQTFEARYELGDEEYDEVNPIRDADGELVAACGLSATESSGDRTGRFYGFTAWLQAYDGRRELSAIGLVTRAGQIARSAAIAEWERRGTIDQVESIERGRQFDLSVAGVRARLTIVDFDYAPGSPGSPGYFGRLVVRYDVEPALS